MNGFVHSMCLIYEKGLLKRIPPLDRSHQVVVSKSLQNLILRNSHYPAVCGQPGGRRLTDTVRRYYCCPIISFDTYRTVRKYPTCAHDRVSFTKISNSLKLFPANCPLDSVSVDFYGRLPKSSAGNLYLLVITQRFSKLCRLVPLRSTTALHVAKIFLIHWVFVYGT